MRIDENAFSRGVVHVLTLRPLRRAWRRFWAWSHAVDKDEAMRRYRRHCRRHTYHHEKYR